MAAPILQSLPAEILSHICIYLENASDIAHLSGTCKRLHEFARTEGWKSYIRSNFAHANAVKNLHDYSQAAHGLMSLSESWSRRAIVARHLAPGQKIKDLELNKTVTEWRLSTRQTMGFIPLIDSYEDHLRGGGGGKVRWDCRHEILAYAAGTSLFFRSKMSDPRQMRPHKVKEFWSGWTEPGSRDGQDDITGLKLLRTEQKDVGEQDDSLHAIVGTASGSLLMLKASRQNDVPLEKVYYNVDSSQQIRSLDVQSSRSPLFAALQNSSLSLFDAYPKEDAKRGPIAVEQAGESDSAAYVTRFISNTRLAVGRGSKKQPLVVYDITNCALQKSRTFGADGDSLDTVLDGAQDNYKSPAGPTSTTLSIIPFPSVTYDGNSNNSTFLSGGHDGSIRIHDLRSPLDSVHTILDPNDSSAIYSLALVGPHGLAAGASKHSMLKLFDIRFAYAPHTTTSASRPISPRAHTIFLASSPAVPQNRRPHSPPRRAAFARRTAESPVYALSVPSPYSPHLYAGIENALLALTFVDVSDPHPDPYLGKVYVQRKGRAGKGKVDPKKSWDPRSDAVPLRMYAQTGERRMQLLDQRGIGVPGAVDQRLEGWGLEPRWVAGW